MPPLGHTPGFRMGLNPYLPSVEVLFSLIVVALCLYVFFRTKELYDLSGHRGLALFRSTFLFFAIAYAFRLIPSLFRMSDLHVRAVMPLFFTAGLYLFAFFSTLAILSLVRMSLPKVGFWSKDFPYHFLAFLLPIWPVIDRSLNTIIVFQLALILFGLALSVAYHKGKRARLGHVGYLLLFVFWTLHLFAAGLPGFLFEWKVTLYLVSLALFAALTFVVVRRLR